MGGGGKMFSRVQGGGRIFFSKRWGANFYEKRALHFFTGPKGEGQFFCIGQQGGPEFLCCVKRGGHKKLTAHEHRPMSPPAGEK